MKMNKLLLALSSVALLASCGAPAAGSNSLSTPDASTPASTPVEEKIELTIDKAEIKVGETAKVTSSVAGVTFSVRDESVATVASDGTVTALKAGSTRITARKEGYRAGNIDITVLKADARAADFYLEFEDADHYDPDGVWGYPQWGMGPGDTPIEETELAHGGKSVGWFTQGCVETIRFTSDKAGKVEMDFMMAYNAEMALDGVLTISVNGVALNLSGKVVAAPADGESYYDFNPVNFKDVDVKAGDNEIVVTALGQGPNMDCVQVYTKELKIEQVKVTPLLRLEGTFTATRVEVGKTYQIPVTTAGVAYASSDASIASVSAAGLVTGVAVGSAKITVSKEGYRSETVDITVYEPAPDIEGAQYLEFEDAEHYIEGGVWGFPQWGMAYDTPVESSDGHGGKHVGWFSAGCKETIRFTSDKAATADLDFMFGRNQELPLDGVLKITVNGVDLDMTGKVVPGPRDGNTNNYNDFQAVSWTGVSFIKGENVIVVEALQQGPNMDCIVVKNTDAKIAQVIPGPVTPGPETSEPVGSEPAPETSEPAGSEPEGSEPAVVDNAVYLEFEKAEHFDPDGFWGMSWNGGSMGPGETPVEDNESAHGGKSIGWFTKDCSESIFFSADKDGKVNLDFIMAYNAEMVLANVMTISVNGVALDLTGKVCPGPRDGNNNNYADWQPVSFADVAVKAGTNSIVVTALAQGPNMDCIKVTSSDVTVAEVIRQSVAGEFADRTIEVGKTNQIVATTAGVSYESSDASVVTVSASGLLTGVKAGSAKITVSKEGMRPATINVNVVNKAAAAEGEVVLELEDATHYSPDGKWGGSWATYDTPVESNAVSSGGKSVGNFKKDCTETLKFTASAAGKAKITLVAASVTTNGNWQNPTMTDMSVADYMTFSVNGKAVDLAGKVLPGKEQAGSDYYNWASLDLGEVDVVSGENTIVITITGQQGPNMDYLRVAGVGGVVIS